MSNLPKYKFLLKSDKGIAVPCFYSGNNTFDKFQKNSDFNVWFFSKVGELLNKACSKNLELFVDSNLFKVLVGSENWLYRAAQASGITIFSVTPLNQTDNLYNRFMQAVLYKLLKLTGNMEFDNVLEPVKNIGNNVLEHYYCQYLNGKSSRHVFINKCSLQQAITSSKEHDGLFNKAINIDLYSSGNTVCLEKGSDDYSDFCLVCFFEKKVS